MAFRADLSVLPEINLHLHQPLLPLVGAVANTRGREPEKLLCRIWLLR